MKTAHNTPTQHCPEKTTPSQNSPPSRLPQLLSHLHFTLSSSHHLPIIPRAPLINTCTPACTHTSAQSAVQSLHTNLCCGYFSHRAAGRGPGGTRLAPFTEPSPAFPPASPVPTPHSARITPPNTHRHTHTHTGTEKELAEYPHYDASLRQQKKEQRTTKNKQGVWLTELSKKRKQAEYGGRIHEKDFFPTWMRYGRNFFCALLFLRISEKRSAG